MKIYQTRTAPNPRRVRIFLAEKGIDMAYEEIDLGRGEQRSADFLKRNPAGLVPVLELDDGTCISESIAICRYFEAQHPEPPLFGSTPLQQATIEMWNRRVEFQFLLPTAMCFQHTHPFFAAQKTQIAEWGSLNKKTARAYFDVLDRHLADNDYIAGETFSVADITALCTVDFSKVNDLRMQPTHSNLQRWYKLVSERPSARA